MTWGEAFDEVAADSRPTEDRAALAAAFFADLREVIEAHNGRTLEWSDVFEKEAA